MAYTLGDITLPRPASMQREPIETSVKHTTLDGTLKKDISGRKWRYVLYFQYLTQAQVSSILSEYDKKEAVDFAVSDGSLTIASTSVHVEVQSRGYEVPGSDYRENFVLVLEEVNG